MHQTINVHSAVDSLTTDDAIDTRYVRWAQREIKGAKRARLGMTGRMVRSL